MKTEIIGWTEFEAKWSQIKKDMLNTKYWGNGLGKPEFYEAFAKEVEKDILLFNEDIKFWEERKRNNRDDFGIRIGCQEIIKRLVKEKEITLWKVKGFLRCGLRLKKYLEKEKREANQNSPQD